MVQLRPPGVTPNRGMRHFLSNYFDLFLHVMNTWRPETNTTRHRQGDIILHINQEILTVS